MFFKIGVLKNFANFTDLQACNFIKMRHRHRCFPVNITKFLRTASFIEHLWWLLLFNIALICHKKQLAEQCKTKLVGLGHRLLLSLVSRNEFLTLTIKKYAKRDVKVFWPSSVQCPVLLDFFTHS